MSASSKPLKKSPLLYETQKRFAANTQQFEGTSKDIKSYFEGLGFIISKIDTGLGSIDLHFSKKHNASSIASLKEHLDEKGVVYLPGADDRITLIGDMASIRKSLVGDIKPSPYAVSVKK